MLNRLFPISSKDEPLVDGLRGLSVFMILLFHCFFAVFVIFKSRPVLLSTFLNDVPFSFLLTTDKAVDIFFLVSVYLLSRYLLTAQKKQFNLSVFYIRRWFRIFPLFFVALLLFGIGGGVDDPTRWVLNLLFLDNWFSNTSIIPVGWSLSVEVQFYATLPLLTFGLLKTNNPMKWLAILILASLLLRLLVMLLDENIYQQPFYLTMKDSSFYMDRMYYSTYSRLTPLLMGLAWAWISLNPSHLKKYLPQRIQILLKYKKTLLLVAGMFIGVAMLYPQYKPEHLYYSLYPQNIFAFLNGLFIWLHRFLFVCGIFLLIYCLKLNWLKHPLWRPISQLCFPMYLFHFPFIAIGWAIILGTVKAKSVTSIAMWQVPLAFLIAIILTFVFSLIVHLLIERPMINLGNKFTGYRSSKN